MSKSLRVVTGWLQSAATGCRLTVWTLKGNTVQFCFARLSPLSTLLNPLLIYSLYGLVVPIWVFSRFSSLNTMDILTPEVLKKTVWLVDSINCSKLIIFIFINSLHSKKLYENFWCALWLIRIFFITWNKLSSCSKLW